MQSVLSALAVLASSSGVASERADFMSLVKTEIDRLNERAASRGGVGLVFSGGGAQAERPEEKRVDIGTERLAGRVPQILARIERELDTVDARIGEKMVRIPS